MNLVAPYLLVIAGGLALGVALFVLSFICLDFIWTHFVVTDPKQIGLGDGVMVVGGGLVIGCTLGFGELLFVLVQFWPGRAAKQAVSKELSANGQ